MSARSDFHFFEQSSLNVIGHGDAQSQRIMAHAKHDGISAEDAWVMLDQHGIIASCYEPERLIKAMQSKKSWNLQIREWATDLADGMLLRMDELREYCEGAPAWIFKATVKQAQRIALNRFGYVPKYTTP